MTRADLQLLRGSLAAVWLWTAAASAWEASGRSAALLAQAGLDGAPAAWLLGGGIALDVVVGLLLWRGPRRLACGIALVATIAMTAIATVALPGLWLDPLGSLAKNLPILAALLALRRDAGAQPS